ncbi:OmpA family protein [Flavobacterium humidisoli]|uniref:OmpA family protein n=1 Tax=Flavobacterium humidisoli TaxID=2937442 RepID=A0ABY4M1J0_9FLAO|nr:OmpA family protein [Flavobacterium humidisoli]UPZ17881.1 OmpA family protein [Flavobacterium humidisoli]
MKVCIKGLYIFLSFFFINSVLAQKKQIAIANEKFQECFYIDAIKIYERLAEKGYRDEMVLKKLGDCYYFNSDYVKSHKWYSQLFAINPKQDPEYIYRYAQSLKSVGNYGKADSYLSDFVKASQSDARAVLLDKNKNYLEIIKSNSGRYQINNLDINSDLSDFGSAVWNSKLVFASSRNIGAKTKKISHWDNNPYNSLFYSLIDNESKLSEPELFSSKAIASKYNESTPVFSKDGRTMYFTRNNVSKVKKDNRGNPIIILKIYKSIMDGENWSVPVELPFNSNEYNVAHPALSPDGKYLFFASNMPGTLGQSDLFFVELKSDGSYSAPKNLGSIINTEGRETFPFITEANELYFSSDGHPGLGGLDVFVATLGNSADVVNVDNVDNVGEPLNSSHDDFCFFINSFTKKGFFTSNRPDGKGLDDIYSLVETRRLNGFILDKVLIDKNSGLPIAGVKISVSNEQFGFVCETVTDSSGRFSVPLDYNKKYYIKAEKEEYLTAEKPIMVSKLGNEDKDFVLQTEKRLLPVKSGDDVARLFDIGILYFDLNNSAITSKASVQLEKMLELLKEYPSLNIEIRTHTDSRGSDAYNMQLSERRNKSIAGWLAQRGIEPKRLSGKGYGESMLVNQCGDGVKCSEEEHQQNRRSEFIFVRP